MEVSLDEVGKRYRKNWVIRSLKYTFESGEKYAIRGPNGSGKTTLLRIISGFLTPSKGRVSYRFKASEIPRSEVFRHINIAAPYIELIEEYTLRELLNFHRNFKPFIRDWAMEDMLNELNLHEVGNERIEGFSSGMKQRLRLLLTFCTEGDLLLVDEPSTNLDEEGKDWLDSLIHRFTEQRTLILASNEPEDFIRCSYALDVSDYK